MRENNRAENSHLAIRRRERKQQKFKSQGSAQRFLSSPAAVYNTFNTLPHLISRPGLRTLRAQAHQAWAVTSAAAGLKRKARAYFGPAELTCQHPHNSPPRHRPRSSRGSLTAARATTHWRLSETAARSRWNWNGSAIGSATSRTLRGTTLGSSPAPPASSKPTEAAHAKRFFNGGLYGGCSCYFTKFSLIFNEYWRTGWDSNPR